MELPPTVRSQPGTHAFHIRARNRDGLWDREGIVYRVTQQPYFYEKNAFHLAVAIVIGLMLLTAYRFRIRQVAAEMNVRFEERLNERTRGNDMIRCSKPYREPIGRR